MRNYCFFPTMLICLIGTFLLAACGSQPKEAESVSTSATPDNAFKQALHEQVSDIMEDNNKAAQQWKELEKEGQKEEQERKEQEIRRKQDEAPYGYNQWGEPYASRDERELDKALDRFEKARQGYINTLDDHFNRNPMDLVIYHKRMKDEIDNCLYYANRIGDENIIKEIKRLSRGVDNLEY